MFQKNRFFFLGKYSCISRTRKDSATHPIQVITTITPELPNRRKCVKQPTSFANGAMSQYQQAQNLSPHATTILALVNSCWATRSVDLDHAAVSHARIHFSKELKSSISLLPYNLSCWRKGEMTILRSGEKTIQRKGMRMTILFLSLGIRKAEENSQLRFEVIWMHGCMCVVEKCQGKLESRRGQEWQDSYMGNAVLLLQIDFLWLR